jgi:hypothetical protein
MGKVTTQKRSYGFHLSESVDNSVKCPPLDAAKQIRNFFLAIGYASPFFVF